MLKAVNAHLTIVLLGDFEVFGSNLYSLSFVGVFLRLRVNFDQVLVELNDAWMVIRELFSDHDLSLKVFLFCFIVFL